MVMSLIFYDHYIYIYIKRENNSPATGSKPSSRYKEGKPFDFKKIKRPTLWTLHPPFFLSRCLSPLLPLPSLTHFFPFHHPMPSLSPFPFLLFFSIPPLLAHFVFLFTLYPSTFLCPRCLILFLLSLSPLSWLVAEEEISLQKDMPNLE